MNAQKSIITQVALLITLLIVVALASTLGDVYYLYNSALDVEKERLSKIVDRQVYIINSLSKQTDEISANAVDPNFTFETAMETILPPEGDVGDTAGFAETGEVVIGQMEGDKIKYIWTVRDPNSLGEAVSQIRVVPLQSVLAEPLRRALQGQKGTMFGFDYMGRTVLASYAHTDGAHWGVVAKLDLAEVQKPFVLAALISLGSAIIILILGYFLFRVLSNPYLERRKVEQELLRHKLEKEVILNNTADGIISMTEGGVILTFNRAAEKIFRYTAKEVLGKNIAILMTGFDANKHDSYVKGYLKSQTKKIIGIGPREVKGVRKDGSPVPIDLAVNEVRRGDDVIFVGSVRDISERTIQRKRLRRSQKIEATGQLTRGIATDFNNILLNIQENLDLLEGKHGSDKQSKYYIANASKASQHGVEMIERLLTFSRRQQLSPKSINLNDVVSDTVKLAKPSLGDKIEVTVDLARDLWSIVADKGQLENTLLSLCLNSRDAMPDGGALTIKTENKTLTDEEARIYSVSPGEYICLKVEDNGMGMTENIVEKVFQPFFTTKDFGRGSGLGLSIIQSYVHQTGGTVILSSELDKGTEVVILLPRQAQVSQMSKA